MDINQHDAQPEFTYSTMKDDCIDDGNGPRTDRLQ